MVERRPSAALHSHPTLRSLFSVAAHRPQAKIASSVSFGRDLVLLFSLPFFLHVNWFLLGLGLGGSHETLFLLYSDYSGNVLNQLVGTIMLAVNVAIARLSRVPSKALALAIYPVAGLLFLALASTLWSEVPWITLRRVTRLAIETTAITALALAYIDRAWLLRLLFRLFAVMTVLSLLSLAIPSWSFSNLGFQGIFENKNYAGQYFFLAIGIFSLGAWKSSISGSRVAALALLICSVGQLGLTLAKTAWLAAPACIVLALVTNWAYQGTARAAMPVIIALLLAFTAIMVTNVQLEYILGVFEDPSLTGRTEIWQYPLTIFESHPIFGAGYGSIWQIGPQVMEILKQYDAYYLINQGHNGYLDILAQLGLVGLFLLTVYLLIVWARVTRGVVTPNVGKVGFSILALYMFFGALIFNLTDSSFLAPSATIWTMFLFLTVSATNFPAAIAVRAKSSILLQRPSARSHR